MPSPPDSLVRLSVGDVEIGIDPGSGGRAVSWTVAGRELLHWRGADPVEHGMYPMAPWAGRIRGNRFSWAGKEHLLPTTYGSWALHGTALGQPTRVVELVEETGLARLSMTMDDHPGWPWPMAVDVEWTLEPRRLTTRIVVHALDASFPCVVGWHPWFRRDIGVGRPLEWALRATTRLVRGDDHLPTGLDVPFSRADGPFDDAFVVPDGRAEVVWPEALAIDIASDSTWFVVYDELPDCACVEPQSGPPDGLVSGAERATAYGGIGTATPERPHVLTTTWSMRDLAG